MVMPRMSLDASRRPTHIILEEEDRKARKGRASFDTLKRHDFAFMRDRLNGDRQSRPKAFIPAAAVQKLLEEDRLDRASRCHSPKTRQKAPPERERDGPRASFSEQRIRKDDDIFGCRGLAQDPLLDLMVSRSCQPQKSWTPGDDLTTAASRQLMSPSIRAIPSHFPSPNRGQTPQTSKSGEMSCIRPSFEGRRNNLPRSGHDALPRLSLDSRRAAARQTERESNDVARIEERRRPSEGGSGLARVVQIKSDFATSASACASSILSQRECPAIQPRQAFRNEAACDDGIVPFPVTPHLAVVDLPRRGSENALPSPTRLHESLSSTGARLQHKKTHSLPKCEPLLATTGKSSNLSTSTTHTRTNHALNATKASRIDAWNVQTLEAQAGTPPLDSPVEVAEPSRLPMIRETGHGRRPLLNDMDSAHRTEIIDAILRSARAKSRHINATLPLRPPAMPLPDVPTVAPSDVDHTGEGEGTRTVRSSPELVTPRASRQQSKDIDSYFTSRDASTGKVTTALKPALKTSPVAKSPRSKTPLLQSMRAAEAELHQKASTLSHCRRGEPSITTKPLALRAPDGRDSQRAKRLSAAPTSVSSTDSSRGSSTSDLFERNLKEKFSNGTSRRTSTSTLNTSPRSPLSPSLSIDVGLPGPMPSHHDRKRVTFKAQAVEFPELPSRYGTPVDDLLCEDEECSEAPVLMPGAFKAKRETVFYDVTEPAGRKAQASPVEKRTRRELQLFGFAL